MVKEKDDEILELQEKIQIMNTETQKLKRKAGKGRAGEASEKELA